jgi:hypothetical protein
MTGQNILNTKHKKVFGKYNDGSSTKERLAELLAKTEEYTRFLLS